MKVRSGLMGILMGFFGGCAIAEQTVQLPPEAEPAAVKAVMTKVADWQLANPGRHHPAHWAHGAMYAGFTAWAHMADTDKYYDALHGFAEQNNWQPHQRIYHADDHVVGIMYLEMFKRFKAPKMMQGIKDRFDYILAHPSTKTLEFKKARDSGLSYGGAFHGEDRWWWCDALFMGPPVWTKLARLTGDRRYLDFMNKEWWATTDYLYDTEEHLYFRDDRYFDQREASGEKIFWSRGNGWVFGGLAKVLEEMPADYPDRPRYEKLFREMAAKIIAIQPDDGLWRASLLDPDSYPTKETSGTGFFTYGLAWGVNHGYLDEKTYMPAVMKAWQGLVSCVHSDGKLGYVQPIGGDPQRNVNKDQTEVYGVGAFLLAGSEVYQLAMRKAAPAKMMTVVNPLLQFRDAVTISIDWSDVRAIPGITKDNVAIFDFKHKRFSVTQPVDNDADGRLDELLFQMDMAPGEIRHAWLMKRPDGVTTPTTESRTYCRFAPDRKDDFLWENDKAAYRMYGPALEDETITCGIDAWGKSVPYPVMDKMLKAYNERGVSYHQDHGEGGDFYKVGNTLGCGGMAPFVDGRIRLPRNFASWKIIANGPIRSIFELTYKPWQAGPLTVSEVKRISIDLGSNLSRIECRYAGENTDTVPLAAGIVLQPTSNKTWSREQAIAYWLPTDPDPKLGWMGCGVVFDSDTKTEAIAADGHWLLTLTQPINRPVVYYAGSCWDRNEEFSSFDQWTDYLKAFAQELETPVKVTFQ
ncbi:MAG TPA: DUF4861 domain-containing protein [Phycisphaerales bacterium]|nr:DUF4861 domain-containing protein [Phycisphaerales bacterium]